MVAANRKLYLAKALAAHYFQQLDMSHSCPKSYDKRQVEESVLLDHHIHYNKKQAPRRPCCYASYLIVDQNVVGFECPAQRRQKVLNKPRNVGFKEMS